AEDVWAPASAAMKVEVAGRLAIGLRLPRPAVPVQPVATLPKASRAVTLDAGGKLAWPSVRVKKTMSSSGAWPVPWWLDRVTIGLRTGPARAIPPHPGPGRLPAAARRAGGTQPGVGPRDSGAPRPGRAARAPGRGAGSAPRGPRVSPGAGLPRPFRPPGGRAPSPDRSGPVRPDPIRPIAGGSPPRPPLRPPPLVGRGPLPP